MSGVSRTGDEGNDNDHVATDGDTGERLNLSGLRGRRPWTTLEQPSQTSAIGRLPVPTSARFGDIYRVPGWA